MWVKGVKVLLKLRVAQFVPGLKAAIVVVLLLNSVIGQMYACIIEVF
jgi:hypothetical protein